MEPREQIGKAEWHYLRIIHELAGGKAKVPVSFREAQESSAQTDDEAGRCCDFWTRRGVLEWPILGHVALTHAGLAQSRVGLVDVANA